MFCHSSSGAWIGDSFNIGSSSGGTDIIAMILKKYSSFDIGKALLISDALITAIRIFYFRYSYKRISYKVPVRDILYFESNRRKISIVTEKDTYEVYEKLNEIEKSLKNCKMPFLRVHQSFLVNYRHVDGLAYDFVIMDNGKKISISEDRRKMISEQYCSMEDTFYVGE